jgi:hypothetical protein
MKNLALLVAFALLALAVPASAAEISEAPPATTLEQQTSGPVAPLQMIPPLIPYCSAVNGTSCTTVGATKRCTDVCSSQLSCTCTSFGGTKFWYCDQEC